MSFYGGFYSYTSVADKQRKAQKYIQKMEKSGIVLHPIEENSKPGSTWWGKAWNQNMTRYADLENRVSRGHSYVRNGFVLDMTIEKGVVKALVAGSSSTPYSVKVLFDVLTESELCKVNEICGQRIDSLEDLIFGRFPKDLGESFLDLLFPSPSAIHFSCSCPDSAYMCKHIAAVIYGIGVRLDEDPLLLFSLRGIDSATLIRSSLESRTKTLLANASKPSDRILDQSEVSKLFGL